MARCSGQAVAHAARSRALAQLPPLTPRPTESPSFMSSSSFAIIHVIIPCIIHVIIRPHSRYHSPSFMSSFAIILAILRYHSCYHSPSCMSSFAIIHSLSFMPSFAIIHVIIRHHACHHSPSFVSSFAIICVSVSHARIIDTTHLDEHGLRTSARRPRTSEPLNTRAIREWPDAPVKRWRVRHDREPWHNSTQRKYRRQVCLGGRSHSLEESFEVPLWSLF